MQAGDAITSRERRVHGRIARQFRLEHAACPELEFAQFPLNEHLGIMSHLEREIVPARV